MKKLCCVLLILSALFSQWTTNPDTPLTLGSGIQPQIAPLADGSVYIAWLSGATFYVYLQLLDPAGYPQFPFGGMLVSDHPNYSWIAVVHLNMIHDSQGNAILSFVDIRTGSWNVFIYKISPAGEFLWGPDGIQLSFGAVDNISPRLLLLEDDAVVVSWCENYSIIHAQKLTADGIPAWGDDGLVIADPDADLQGPYSILAEDGTLLLRWIRQTGTFWSPNSELFLQNYDTDGSPLWAAPAEVSGVVTFPMGNWSQQLVSDGASGSYSAWTVLAGTSQSAFAQSVEADGTVSWGAGVELSTLSDHFRTNSVIAVGADSHDLTAFWTQANGSQSQRGIYAQRLSPAGDRQWGNSGLPVIPLNGDHNYLDLSTVPFGEDALLVYIQQNGMENGDLYALRLDEAGNFVWPSQIIPLTTSGGGKSDAAISKGPGCVFAAWSKSGEIQAHCLRSDGTLGAPIVDDDCLPNGDVNSDGSLDILDIVTIVNFILGQQIPDDTQQCAADLNADGELNILDIVLILNLIVGV